MIRQTDSLRANRAALEAEIRAAGGTIRLNSATCIAHEDSHPSASIYQGEDGAWRLKCHVPTCGFCGDIFDIRARRQGRDVGEVLKEVNAVPDPPARKPKRLFASVGDVLASVSRYAKIEAHYIYSDPDTLKPEVIQIRCRDGDRKQFLVHHAQSDGFVLGAPPKPWPIYNRARVRDASTVIVVEGEKCVHALHDLGIVATTSLSGAQNADKADWSPLAGKRVFVWPDNDEPGLKYAKAVVRELDKLNPKPEVYLLPVSGLGLPDGGDVVDFIADGGSASEVWSVLNDGAELVGAETELLARIHEIVTGKWVSLDWPWRQLGRWAKPLFPGTITVICGDPAASKSFFMLQAAHYWHKQGIKIALYELEEDRSFHMLRLLAVLSGSWEVLDDSWGREHPEELKLLYDRNRADLESFSPLMDSAPMGVVDYSDILKWMKEKCETGAQILIIDPITAVATGDRRDREDLAFIVKASTILREYGARLVVVTHPRLGTGNKKATTSQDDLAGGRAFSRHTQTVLWLHRHEPPKQILCKNSVGQMMCRCNRSVHIAKARNGPGHGWTLGFTLDPNVQFVEHGVEVKGTPEPSHVADEIPSF